jgi:NTP pyrophosphatase (non-canonical NTP hydrolase)
MSEQKDYPEYVGGLLNRENFRPDIVNSILHATCGLTGEAGELLDMVKKIVWQGHPIIKEDIKKELGDIRFYYQALLNFFELTDAEVIAGNTEKLTLRYPDNKFSAERSLNRKE